MTSSEQTTGSRRFGGRGAWMTMILLAAAALAAPRAAVAQQQPPDAPPALPSLPVQPEVDKTYPLRVENQTRGVRLMVNNAAKLNEYGAHKAAEGKALLVLSTEWENIIPLQYVQERKEALATLYKIPNLADHVYLVFDGKLVARLDKAAEKLPGHVPVKDFTLEKLGDRMRGNLVFEIPADERLGWGELRYYDFAHGHMTIPLGDPAAEQQAKGDGKPVAPPLKNEVVEAAAFGVQKVKEYKGQKAPDGMTFVLVDLRARSMFVIDGDATAFDSKAKPGQRLPIGTVADWKENVRHTQLVVDGEYGYAPIPKLTEVPEEPRFLPDVMTGGVVAFVAPEKHASLELRCDFPNAALPDNQVIRPKGLTLPLGGQRPQLAARAAIAALVDDFFRVNVVGQKVADTFAGAKAADGKRFLSLEVTVQNAGQTGEFFQTKEQLKYVDAKAQQLEMDPATFNGVHQPSALLWIPPGERRTFEVAYQVPADERQPRLAYTGVSMAKVVDLQPMEKAIAAAQAATKPVEPAMSVADATPAKPPVVEKKPDAAAAAKPMPPKQTTPAQKPKPKEPPTRVSVHPPDLTPKGIAGVGLTVEQVNGAIDRGADALWKFIWEEDLDQGKARGYALGSHDEHIISALALVHSGAHKRIPEFDAALQEFLANVRPHENMGTYNLGIICMLVEAYEDPRYYGVLREAAKCLLEGQSPHGAWDYGRRLPPELFTPPPDPNPLKVDGGVPLDGTGDSAPLKRDTKPDEADDGDNSVSQYAILGLNSAIRSGVELPADVWKNALKMTQDRQNKDGGWAYHGKGGGSYGSMSAAGVCALALARHHLGEENIPLNEDIERGVAWLFNNFTVTEHAKYGQTWHYYYLYSLERVGRILDTEFIGDKEWYPIGARYLIDNQKADGTWESRGDSGQPRLPGAFALLFLTRATPTLAVEHKRGGTGSLKTAVSVPPSMRLHIILDASGSMLEEMDGRMKFDIAKEAVTQLVQELPDTAEVGLRVYGHRKRAIEKDASEDTELVISRKKLNKGEFTQTIAALRCRGKTPLARSLLEAKGEVGGGDARNPVNVILLTDGGEDSQPRQDPLKAAAEFGQVEHVRLHVVGFDIGREDWSEQLQGIARSAGGAYYPAAKGESLLRELRNAVFGTPEFYTVLTEDGSKELGRGKFGDTKTLQEGKYRLRTTFGGYEFEQPFWINTEGTTAVTFDAAKVAAAIADGKFSRPAGGGENPAGVTAVRQTPPPMAEPPANAAPPAAGGAKFCTSCGAKLAAGAKFCTSCGTKTGG